MTSILSSISELERLHDQQTTLLGIYLQAIKSAAQYAVELDDKITGPYRRHLAALADQVASGRKDVVAQSGATFRGLLRDYRDQAAHFVQQMREELASTAGSLQETLDALAQSAGDHEIQVKKSVVVLRDATEGTDIGVLRTTVRKAADGIESSLEQLRKEHQLTIAQFRMEIRMLHQRIDSMEAAAPVENMTSLFNRAEMESRIRSAPPGGFHLLLFQVHGIRRAESQFGNGVGDELAAAFAKRLGNTLPKVTTFGRWSPEEFIALVAEPRDPKSSTSRWSTDSLSGTYSCLRSGKTLRPSLQVTVGIVDSSSRETADKTLDRVKMFLTGAM